MSETIYYGSDNIVGIGNVGVGTTTPGTSLQCYTSSASYGITHTTGTATFGTYINNTSTPACQFGTLTNHGLGFFVNGGSPDKLVISASGAVGIGVNPTTYTLQVAGTIGSTSDITAFTSDERLKTKTGPITDALDKVCTLDTFTYTHNDLARSFGFTDKRQYVGISAQQVQKVQPEVVRMAPFDADGEKSKSGEDYMTVQYERLVPLLIEALKEERLMRESLEESLRSLEERIKLLEQK
jgi:hypothetical protein